eukprot:TRINITY_DN22614_c0_g1_i2.p1 TRINITY_DN22614_c0_g1~~TRINITY_DN22614_c0_g1_i2.p1  ORF type:complete len:331 (+),score=118.55 TRINITY_DN22614_c0_g1_i2:67-1059(+)
MPLSRTACAVAGAAVVADAVTLTMRKAVPQQSAAQPQRQGCGPLKHLSALAKKTNRTGPGAGLGDIAPFEESFMDGYSMMGCIQDEMHEFGDKFGDGKFSYKLGDTSNVAIVRYSMHVAREDAQEMTHAVCFDFCRTIPDMLFFGITNGRDCYCAPYVKQVAGDSSDCDAVCDGDKSTMCGGKTKSSVFEMHACNDAVENLDNARAAGDAGMESLGKAVEEVQFASTVLQGGGSKLQPIFGKVGDVAAGDLLQSAKAYAGKLEHAAEDGSAARDALQGVKDDSDPEGDKGMEELTAKLHEALEKAGEQEKSLSALKAEAVCPGKSEGRHA